LFSHGGGQGRGFAPVAKLRSGGTEPEDGPLFLPVYRDRSLNQLLELQVSRLPPFEDCGLQIGRKKGQTNETALIHRGRRRSEDRKSMAV
jgi:hypothetical protein